MPTPRASSPSVQGRASFPADRLGVAIIGLGGAVSTTAIAGLALLRAGHTGLQGLPLATLPAHLTQDLVPYDRLVFGGWDFNDDDLAAAAAEHAVLSETQLRAAASAMQTLRPWPAISNERFCRGVTGAHAVATTSHRATVAAIEGDLRRFRADEGLERVVMLNLASTEATADLSAPIFRSAEAFEEALDADDERIGPAMLYAYAAIASGTPYLNFTPSVGADVPALVELARAHGVPLAGKDGKTGQTFVKTLVAPGLRARGLEVEGWFSTNILGNRDGEALRDKDSLASKLNTKGSVLDQIMGYPVEDHVVNINYYRPRGDNKEAWDNIDLIGFLGQKMQVKINFLCRDSILAAPLAIELARLADAAQRRGEGGVVEAFGVFFKSPMTSDGAEPEHAFGRQQQALLDWLAAPSPGGDGVRAATDEVPTPSTGVAR